jgi:hypothetical protein
MGLCGAVGVNARPVGAVGIGVWSLEPVGVWPAQALPHLLPTQPALPAPTTLPVVQARYAQELAAYKGSGAAKVRRLYQHPMLCLLPAVTTCPCPAATGPRLGPPSCAVPK